MADGDDDRDDVSGLDDAPASERGAHLTVARLEWPLTPPADPLWKAALEADVAGGAPGSAADAWRDFATGHLRVRRQSVGLERVYALGRIDDGPGRDRPALSLFDAAITLRALCGEAWGAIAGEGGATAEGVRSRFDRSLEQRGLSARSVPLPLVVAAQSWAGAVRSPDARSTPFEHRGRGYLVLSVPRPVTAAIDGLSAEQREVAQMWIEGRSADEIGRRRGTSPSMVGAQLEAIERALALVGRFALIRRALDLECFAR